MRNRVLKGIAKRKTAKKLLQKVEFNHPGLKYAHARANLAVNYKGRSNQLLSELVQDKPEPKYFYWLAVTFLQMNNSLYACENFEKASNLGYDNKFLHRYYGIALGRMDRPAEAIEEWNKYLEKTHNPGRNDLFTIGLQHKLAGNETEAYEYFELVIPKEKKVKTLWELFAKRGYWQYAIEEISKELETNPDEEGKLNGKLGYYHYNLGHHSQAITAYNKSLEKEVRPLIQYYLALVYEQLEDYDKALEILVEIDTTDVNVNVINRVNYNIGKCYMREGQFENAAKAFSLTELDTDITNENILENESFIAANNALISGDNMEAAKLFEQTIFEYAGHSSQLFALAGAAYYIAGDYEAACRNYIQEYVIQRDYNIKQKRLRGKRLQKLSYYTEYYKNMELNENYVLYNAYHGDNFNDSPYALFKELYKRPELKHFIIVKSEDKVRDEIKQLPNVYLVKYEERFFLRILATAGLIITNTTLPAYFMRRDGQKVLNTWHGTPIKYLGYDIETNPFVSSRNVTNLFMQNTHLVNPNQFTEDALINSFGLRKTDDTQFAITGYPRQDLMINATQERKDQIRQFLDIPKDKKVVLYAPTFRGSNNKTDNREKEMLTKACKLLEANNNFHFIFKGHYFEDTVENKANVVDTNELLSIVDVLITDYSSIAIDFLAMNRPIIYFTYDIDEYRAERGFYFEIDEISNNLVETPEKLVALVEEQIANPVIDSKQFAAKDRFCSLDDGNASKRVLDFTFSEPEVKTLEKKNVLIYPGNVLAMNGISTSFKNLVSLIDKDKYDITIVLPDGVINRAEDQSPVADLRADGYSIICYYGFLNRTVEEDHYLKNFAKNKAFPSEYGKELYNQLWLRKSKQIFGTRKFDTIINFDSGYTMNMHALLAATPARRKLLVLHADMESERIVRYPNLKTSFNLFDNYDKILTVSESVSALNIENLSQEYNIDKSKFDVLENTLNYDIIAEKAVQELEVVEDNAIFETGNKIFISIGRISPEKNLEVTIRAFAKLREKYDNITYILLGGGAQETKLKVLISELGVEDSVFLLGMRSNPFNYMKKSDCMLFPSLHEGQPMVLLEALSNDLDILASNIPASVEMIDKYGGKYIENTVDSFATEMENYIENNTHTPNNFDPYNYNQARLEKLYNFIEN